MVSEYWSRKGTVRIGCDLVCCTLRIFCLREWGRTRRTSAWPVCGLQIVVLSFFFVWCKVKVKVKCTLVQALRLCTGRAAHRGSRGIALPFHDHGTRKRVRGQRHTPAALYPRERPGTHCTGGWVGLRAGLDRCGKSRPHRDSIPGPSSP